MTAGRTSTIALALFALCSTAGCRAETSTSALTPSTTSPAPDVNANVPTGTAPSAAAATASPTPPQGPSWAQYLVIRDGRSCRVEIDQDIQGTKLVNASVQTIQHVRRTAEGISFTQHGVTISTTDGVPNDTSEPPRDVPYLIGTDGALRTRPADITQGGVSYSFRGFEVYPRVEEVRAGGHHSSDVTLTLRGTTAAARQQLATLLPAGQTQLRARLHFDIGPAPRRDSIKTPVGVSHDIVGVSYKVRVLEFEGAPAFTPQERATLDSLANTFSAGAVYYARGYGIVASRAVGTEFGAERCTG